VSVKVGVRNSEDMSEEASVEDQLMPDEPAAASEDEGANSQDGEEGVYEIEAILEARRNMYGKSRMGYFVKWKGYGEEENSWIDEKDAGGATELIREYWKTRPKNQASSSKEKATKGRTSTRKSDAGASTRTIPSKRVLNVDSESEDGNMNASKKNGSMAVETDNEQLPQGVNVNGFANKKSWEKDIQEIETVERDANGMLTVYFKLGDGKRAKEEHRIARQRFPQKLLDFYEHSIAWRDEDGQLVSRNSG